METLGYGSHLILDGFKADAGALLDEAKLRTLLEALAEALEPRMTPKVLLERLDGPQGGWSGAVLQAESHVTLHTFPELQAVTLSVFSRRGLDVRRLSEALEAHLGIRRFESHLKNHSRTLAKDPARQRRTLLGDRQYAAVRLQDLAVL